MSHDNETGALGLHMEVLDKRNLSVTPRRCNTGTLRLPSDPSWPKVPPRRLNDNIDGIESPYVVTLTGTPRKGRIKQIITCQYTKPRKYQKHETSIVARGLPDCIDPRFKRQIIRQNIQKPDESSNTRNNEKQIKPELDISLRKTEEPVDNSRRTNQILDGDTRLYNIDKSLETTRKLVKGTIVDCTKEQCALGMNHCTKISQHAIDEQINAEDTFFQGQKQEADKPLLLMVDEKKVHALPVNTFNEETASPSTQAQQCYSVQIPVVTYHNIRVQNIPMQMQKDIKILYKCQSDSIKCKEIVEDICGVSDKMCISKDSKNAIDVQQHNVKNGDGISVNEDISHCDDGRSSVCMHDEKSVNSNIPLDRNVLKEISPDNNYDGNFDKMDNKDDSRNSEGSSNPNAVGKSRTLVERGHNDLRNNVGLHRSHSALYNDLDADLNCRNTCSCIIVGNRTADECVKRQRSSEMRITKSWMHPCVSTWKRGLVYPSCVKDRRGDIDESPINVTNNKISSKNTQGLALTRVRGRESNTSKENKTERREMCSASKCKTVSTGLSKKAKSFFQKKSRLAIANSDCTLILPGPRYIKDKKYEKIRLKVSRLLHRRNGINSMNSIRMKSNSSKQSRISRSHPLTNLQAGNTLFEKPSSIPSETQRLLNKSYWEYYRKLSHKTALARSGEEDRHSNELCDYLPESQMLQQCSVLSCMINNTLDRTFRDSTATDKRSSSNPNAKVTPNVHGNIYKVSASSSMPVKRIERKKTRKASTQLLGLKAIALFGIIAYVTIIFLPMMYDYFFGEEYSDYENINYIGLMLEYIVSSFGEAFGGVFNISAKGFVQFGPFNLALQKRLLGMEELELLKYKRLIFKDASITQDAFEHALGAKSVYRTEISVAYAETLNMAAIQAKTKLYGTRTRGD